MKSDWVGDLEEKALGKVAKDLRAVADDCESPIERALFWALVRVLDRPIAEDSKPSRLTWVDEQLMDLVTLYPQRPWPLPGPKYRLDFGMGFVWEKRSWLVAVECDGHDFHERTKEQAANDRARDRELMLSGVRTVRFTGSEIYRDPQGCALALLRQLDSVVEEAMRPAREVYAKERAQRAGGLQ